MSMENGPDFDFGKESVALNEIERLDLMADLMRDLQAHATEGAVEIINTDPIAHTLLGKLVEGGPEYSQDQKSHMRRILAVRLFKLPQLSSIAQVDAEFYELAAQSVRNEIEELENIPGVEDIPDVWDIALEDLLRLDGSEE